MTEPAGSPDGVPVPVALFLDFDGTLVDLAPTPDAVVVPADLVRNLARLRDRLDGALAIVTGRAIDSLDAFLPGFDISGLHGLERRIAGTRRDPDFPVLTAEVAALREEFARFPGTIVEDKGIGVGIHWRLAPDAEDEARRALGALAARLGPRYRIQDGKAVSEVVPGGTGKGDGIRALGLEPPFLGRRPVFLGDDRTDEHGFAAVEEAGGVAIKVGPEPTAASRRLGSVAAVRDLLARWAADGVDTREVPPSR